MLHSIVIKEEGSNRIKRIGRYDDIKNIFFTSRDTSKHLLRNKNALAIDYKLFKEILLPKNAFISIRDYKKNCLYNVYASVFAEHGEEIEYLNHRKQICLNLDYFHKEKL